LRYKLSTRKVKKSFAITEMKVRILIKIIKNIAKTSKKCMYDIFVKFIQTFIGII